ncbi:amino acid adenylation domain-containing protein [Saccharothrix sp. ST-888]|uniref:amino acid adenylation domain-containing protein n=1 Tax=Saccharothrix sp. ST-888 TaxID=1427391 RepID=UPI000618D0BA|nr:amino acid adenylation domain-containing protein [Saccharothrix sp. ST-888]BAR64194.1 putative non-ribosomal peptide synthase [Saccharothrix sp. ST-888]
MAGSELPADVGSLPELFARVAGDRGDAPAVAGGGHEVGYAELDRSAEAVAALLGAAGIGRGDLVGVLLERSHQAPAWILGVLKAGAAYVPLDPSYPPERLAYLAEDAGLAALVAAPERAAACGLDSLPVIDPAATPPAPAAAAAPPGPDDPAYVIYTSGSTGLPKGCVVTHGNVLALLRATLPLFDVDADDRWTLFHSAAFDFSVWELWGAWACGGTAVVVPAETAQAPEEFLRLLRDERVTVLNQVPSAFRYLAREYADSGAPALPLRYVVFGGESVDLDVVRAFLAAVPESAPEMVNMYGITEITVHATYLRLTPEDLAGEVRSPIGRPLPHLSVELRDEELRPVEDGAVGEMWVAGAGVATGYLNRPELSADRFRTLDGRRLYRTGDLARRLPDGQLAYLGRNDQQVKLRGHRVELGEVEAGLRTAEQVSDAAALVTRDSAGNDLLTALVVPAVPGTLDVAALRRHARTTMPGQLVPNRFHRVDALPLTSSGKLDRRALAELAAEAAAPRPRILVVDPIHQGALEELQRRHDVTVALRPPAEELLRLVRDKEVVVLRSGVRLDAGVIAAANRLKVIARAGSGVDNIDLAAARAAGVTTFNIPAVSAPAVAELALGLMLTVGRHIALADRQVRQGIWNKSALSGAELAGKTLGLVGLGRIGSRIAALGRALGMRVLVDVDRATEERRRELELHGYELVALDQLLPAADVVCLAVPLTEQTHHLIDAAALAVMKPTSLLVNVSRGLVVDEDALYEALAGGGIAGAGLDVVAREGQPNRLSELDNVVITPHIGAMSADSQARIGRILVDSVNAALAGREVANTC